MLASLVHESRGYPSLPRGGVGTEVGRSIGRLLVADDDPLIVRMLTAAIKDEPDLEIVAVATDGTAAVGEAIRTRPDLALLDVSMPGGGGAAAAREISERLPDTRIVAFSGHEDLTTVRSMLDARIDRYVVKTTGLVDLISVMRSVLAEPATTRRVAEPDAVPRPSRSVTTVLLAIRDPTELLALAQAVEADSTLSVIGLAQTPDHAASLAARHSPDIAVIDGGLEPAGGRRAAEMVVAASSATQIISLWSRREGIDLVSAIRARIDGRELSRSDSIQGDLLRALRGEGLRTLRQPIMDLNTGRPVGFEALTRIDGGSRPADMWFTAAAALGLGESLEVAAARSAISLLPQLPEDTFLAVNVSPAVAVSPRFADVIESSFAERIVLELTEHTPVDDYTALDEALGTMRDRGVRIAVDDAGAGFASLRHVLRLAPDFIKLDNSLCHGIGDDTARRAMAKAMVAFAAETRSLVVAEGLEDQADVEAVRDLAVPLGQGYRLGMPA